MGHAYPGQGDVGELPGGGGKREKAHNPEWYYEGLMWSYLAGR